MPDVPQTPKPAGKAGKDYVTIDRFLQEADTALTNAKDAEIAPLLALRGYPAATVTELTTELAALRTLAEKQKQEYGEQYSAGAAFEAAYAQAHADYMDHVKLARLVFKGDTGAQTALGLRGDRAASQSGYISQGLQFYDTALGSVAYLTALGKKGIFDDELETGRSAFRSLQGLAAAQQKETGEAQEATKKRDAAYDALAEKMSDFYETAKVALRKQPQMRERLGLKEE